METDPMQAPAGMGSATLDEPRGQQVDEAPVLAAEPGTSVLDGLRATRERVAAETAKTFTRIVPHWRDGLAVRYVYPEDGYKRLVAAFEKTNQSADKDARLFAACDIHIAACGAVVGRLEDGTIVDLLTDEPLGEHQLPAEPLRFNRKLAEKLDIDLPEDLRSPARFILRNVFSPMAEETGRYEGDLALISIGNVVYQWLNGNEDVVDEAQLGE